MFLEVIPCLPSADCWCDEEEQPEQGSVVTAHEPIDEGEVVVFRVGDKPVAVIRVTLPETQLRQNISLLKAQARKAFDAWLETPSSEDVAGEE